MAQVTSLPTHLQDIPVRWVPGEYGLKAVPTTGKGYIGPDEIRLANGEVVKWNSLRAYGLAFGKFRGLALGEIADLEKGRFALSIDGVSIRDKGEPIEVMSDRDGIQYLDWLLGENWLYPETRQKIEAFMRHPRMQRRLAEAIAPKQDGEPVLTGSDPLPALMPLGDDIISSGFTVAETYDNGKWKTHGQALWINTKPSPIDPDPTPWDLRGYELNEPTQGGVRRGRASDESVDPDDGWKPSLAEEEPRDWRPAQAKELNGYNVFFEAVGFLTRLEQIGSAATRTLDDTDDAFGQVVPGARRQLESLIAEIKTRFSFEGKWRHTVPTQIREAIASGVDAAWKRLRNIAFLEERLERVELLAEAIAADLKTEGPGMSILDTAASLDPKLTIEACQFAGLMTDTNRARIARHADTGCRLLKLERQMQKPKRKSRRASSPHRRRQLVATS